MENKKDSIVRIYGLAVAAGLCSRKQEFAQLLGVERSGLSSAMSGKEKYLTDSLILKVQAFAKRNGLEDLPAVEEPKNKGVWLPEETRQIFENMSQTIRIQAELIAHYTGAITLDQQYLRAVAPKNEAHRGEK